MTASVAPGGGWAPPVPPPPRRRPRLWIWIVLGLVVVSVVALINAFRNNDSHSSSIQPGPALTPPRSAAPSTPAPGTGAPNSSGSSGGQGGNGGTTVPAVSCPDIRDDESHLSYSCIEDKLTQGEPDSLLGLRISLDELVEPGWVISEGSGNPRSLGSPRNPTTIGFTAGAAIRPAATTTVPVATPSVSPTPSAVPSLAAVQAEVRRRAQLAVDAGYGDNPTATLAGERTRVFSGVIGFQVQLNISIDPAYRAARGLKTSTERLWVVGVPTRAGVSIFMLTIPNLRSDLWPKADATIASVRVI